MADMHASTPLAEAVDHVIAACLQPDPCKRPTAREIVAVLSRALGALVPAAASTAPPAAVVPARIAGGVAGSRAAPSPALPPATAASSLPAASGGSLHRQRPPVASRSSLPGPASASAPSVPVAAGAPLASPSAPATLAESLFQFQGDGGSDAGAATATSATGLAAGGGGVSRARSSSAAAALPAASPPSSSFVASGAGFGWSPPAPAASVARAPSLRQPSLDSAASGRSRSSSGCSSGDDDDLHTGAPPAAARGFGHARAGHHPHHHHGGAGGSSASGRPPASSIGALGGWGRPRSGSSGSTMSASASSSSSVRVTVASGVLGSMAESVATRLMQLANIGGARGSEIDRQRWVVKATSVQAGPPKGKYVRRLVMDCWEAASGPTPRLPVALQQLPGRPVATNGVVALKCAVLMLKLVQQGPPSVLQAVCGVGAGAAAAAGDAGVAGGVVADAAWARRCLLNAWWQHMQRIDGGTSSTGPGSPARAGSGGGASTLQASLPAAITADATAAAAVAFAAASPVPASYRAAVAAVRGPRAAVAPGCSFFEFTARYAAALVHKAALHATMSSRVQPPGEAGSAGVATPRAVGTPVPPSQLAPLEAHYGMDTIAAAAAAALEAKVGASSGAAGEGVRAAVASTMRASKLVIAAARSPVVAALRVLSLLVTQLEIVVNTLASAFAVDGLVAAVFAGVRVTVNVDGTTGGGSGAAGSGARTTSARRSMSLFALEGISTLARVNGDGIGSSSAGSAAASASGFTVAPRADATGLDVTPEQATVVGALGAMATESWQVYQAAATVALVLQKRLAATASSGSVAGTAPVASPPAAVGAAAAASSDMDSLRRLCIRIDAARPLLCNVYEWLPLLYAHPALSRFMEAMETMPTPAALTAAEDAAAAGGGAPLDAGAFLAATNAALMSPAAGVGASASASSPAGPAPVAAATTGVSASAAQAAAALRGCIVDPTTVTVSAADVASATSILARACAIPGNDRCAECGANDVSWASVNLGILLCLRCSGAHRQLGVHLSVVRSLSLDKWKPAWLHAVLCIGNTRSNAFWEACLPSSTAALQRPKPPSAGGVVTPLETVYAWAKNKYERRLFVPATARVTGSSALDAPPAAEDLAADPAASDLLQLAPHDCLHALLAKLPCAAAVRSACFAPAAPASSPKPLAAPVTAAIAPSASAAAAAVSAADFAAFDASPIPPTTSAAPAGEFDSWTPVPAANAVASASPEPWFYADGVGTGGCTGTEATAGAAAGGDAFAAAVGFDAAPVAASSAGSEVDDDDDDDDHDVALAARLRRIQSLHRVSSVRSADLSNVFASPSSAAPPASTTSASSSSSATSFATAVVHHHQRGEFDDWATQPSASPSSAAPPLPPAVAVESLDDLERFLSSPSSSGGAC